MELLLVLAVLAIAIFMISRSGRSKPSRAASKHRSTLKPSRSRTTPLRSRPAPDERFDEKSAKHLQHKRILTGSAWITDGDTIKIKHTQIRLFGIDAPEINHPYGNKAKWALFRLCKGHTIRAEITDEDEYGRTVARCFLPDGRDLSAEMVKQGLALDWPKFSGGIYRNLETPNARKRLFLADARQKGRMHVWESFEAKQKRL